MEAAEHGQDALRKIEEFPPDLMLTDIRMPVMDGLELCKRVASHYPYIQRVVISGYSDFEYARTCMKHGVKEYLLKPVTKPDMHELLDKLLLQLTRSRPSIIRWEAWLNSLFQAVFVMNVDEVRKLVDEWRQTAMAMDLLLTDLQEMLTDSIHMLVKRLSERECAIQAPQANWHTFRSPELAFNHFESLVLIMVQQLADYRQGSFKDPVVEAKRHIEEHLSEEITLEELADLVGLTPTYFSYFFKKETGSTFSQYRIAMRMELAQKLLAIPHMKIMDVAEQVGYTDYPHFNKMFKKCTGLSPTEYRAKLGIR